MDRIHYYRTRQDSDRLMASFPTTPYTVLDWEIDGLHLVTVTINKFITNGAECEMDYLTEQSDLWFNSVNRVNAVWSSFDWEGAAQDEVNRR